MFLIDDHSDESDSLYAIYNTVRRQFTSYVKKDSLFKDKTVYDIKPNPANEEEIFCTLYSSGSATVAKVMTLNGNVEKVCETDIFLHDSPNFFKLDKL